MPFAFAHGSQGGHTAGNGIVSQETRARLDDIERRRRQLAVQAALARKKERLALLQLSAIKTKLNITTGALKDSKHKLHKTETRITETQASLERTQSDQSNLTQQAAIRLREIYEGQRLNLVEMIFQVQSLQGLLDLFYYQERIAAMDRQLLETLRAEAIQLAARKTNLGKQKNKLGDLISEFARKALQIRRQKTTQEQIAEKLKTQRAFYEQAERQLAVESQQLEKQICDMESAHKRSTKKLVQGSGKMSLPLKALITSPFGWRRHPIFGLKRFHTGVDLAGPNRSPIKAADSGNVLYTGWYGGYGKVVIVSHGHGVSTLYAHLSAIKAASGQNVQKGDIIGFEGTTGFSTGPHCHFEVRINGKPDNPLNYAN